MKRVRKAFAVWFTGMVGSISGLFLGQYLMQFFNNQTAFMIVTWLWSSVFGFTTFCIGLFILIDEKGYRSLLEEDQTKTEA